MEFSKQKNVLDKLKKYDYLANENDYISVSEWSNYEGVDIDLNGKQLIRLTNGELEAIYYLAKSLEFNREENNEEK